MEHGAVPMAGYTKLFSTILASTIWEASKETKILWVTLLAMSDKHGCIHASVPGLATMARLTIAEIEAALTDLLSPDPYSRTKDFEGRRIEEIDGGWLILNHQKYRDQMSYDDKREYNRIKQQESRARQQCQTMSNNVKDSQGSYVSVDVSVSKKDRGFVKPSIDEVRAYLKERNSQVDAEAFVAYYESNGWRVGKNSMKDWHAAVRTWEKNQRHFSASASAPKPENGPPSPAKSAEERFYRAQIVIDRGRKAKKSETEIEADLVAAGFNPKEAFASRPGAAT